MTKSSIIKNTPDTTLPISTKLNSIETQSSEIKYSNQFTLPLDTENVILNNESLRISITAVNIITVIIIILF